MASIVFNPRAADRSKTTGATPCADLNNIGGAVAGAGFILGAVIVGIWIDRGFGSLAQQKLAIVAATLVTVGAETFFTSFLLSILGLRRRD